VCSLLFRLDLEHSFKSASNAPIDSSHRANKLCPAPITSHALQEGALVDAEHIGRFSLSEKAVARVFASS